MMTRHLEMVADGIYRLEETLPGVATVFAAYFVRGGGGALVEPGPSALAPALQEALVELGMAQPEYIIPTHIHLDHGGSLGTLARLLPEAKVVLNQQGARHVIEPSRLIKSTRMAFGDDFESVYGPIVAVPEDRVRVVADGERLSLDGRELVIVATPGHAPHHIAIFDTKSRGLFCGEALGLVYSPGYPPLPAVAPPSFDLERYLKDMAKLRALEPSLLFYSHGDVEREPERLIAAVMENTRLLGDFILHHLKAGESAEAIISHVADYLKDRFGATLDEYELVTNVHGYIHYFQKKKAV